MMIMFLIEISECDDDDVVLSKYDDDDILIEISEYDDELMLEYDDGSDRKIIG